MRQKELSELMRIHLHPKLVSVTVLSFSKTTTLCTVSAVFYTALGLGIVISAIVPDSIAISSKWKICV